MIAETDFGKVGNIIRQHFNFSDEVGLDWDLLKIRTYNPVWPEVYRQESEFLKSSLASWLIATEHVGSTSVSGMAAKPVIDIIGPISSVDALYDNLPVLMNTGYRFLGECGREGRFFCTYSLGMRTIFHLHLVERGHTFRVNLIDFRERLLADSNLAESYSAYKYSLEIMNCDRLDYRDRKNIWFVNH